MKFTSLNPLTTGAIGLLILAFAAPVSAVTWQRVARSDRATLYFDSDSVQRRGSAVEYSAYVVLDAPDSDGALMYKTREVMDCKAANYRINQLAAYNSHGQLLYEEKDGRSPLFSIVPGSLKSGIFDRLCKK